MKRIALVLLFALLLVSVAQAVTMPAGLIFTEWRWIVAPSEPGENHHMLVCTIKNTSNTAEYTSVRTEFSVMRKSTSTKVMDCPHETTNLHPSDKWRFTACCLHLAKNVNRDAIYQVRLDRVVAYTD